MQDEPRKRDKEASKQRLLRGGLDVFSNYGYDAAIVKMIAANHALFGGESGLLLAVLTASLEENLSYSDYTPSCPKHRWGDQTVQSCGPLGQHVLYE
jgi:hypothetical protein